MSPSDTDNGLTSRQPKSRRAFRDLILSDLGPTNSTARFVAVALIQRMDSASMESFASAECIAKLTGLGHRAVRNAFAKLVAEGWLVERTKERGRDYWLKIRRANIPTTVRLTAETGSSRERPQTAVLDTSQDARLPAQSGATHCQNAHGDPVPSADDPVPRSRIRNPVPRSAVATRQRGQTGDPERDARIQRYWNEYPQYHHHPQTIAMLANASIEDVRRVTQGWDPIEASA
jgi:hypothetical protein